MVAVGGLDDLVVQAVVVVVVTGFHVIVVAIKLPFLEVIYYDIVCLLF